MAAAYCTTVIFEVRSNAGPSAVSMTVRTRRV
jgi:hypothetical protein